MALIKAYHAGDFHEITDFIQSQSYITPSCNSSNWLGNGVYFWENDASRAELWQLQKSKGLILECDIDTRNLLNLLEHSNEAQQFFSDAHTRSMKYKNTILNNRATQRFDLDCKIFNTLPRDIKTEFAGIRMAFFLGDSVSEDGNLFTDQHIQICLWDLSVVQNPKKYIPCAWQ